MVHSCLHLSLDYEQMGLELDYGYVHIDEITCLGTRVATWCSESVCRVVNGKRVATLVNTVPLSHGCVTIMLFAATVTAVTEHKDKIETDKDIKKGRERECQQQLF